MTDIESLLGAGYVDATHGRIGVAADIIRQALASGSISEHNALEYVSGLEATMSAGRRCHLTEVYAKVLKLALQGVTE